jgi:tRNA(Ile)-lysidine synthase
VSKDAPAGEGAAEAALFAAVRAAFGPQRPDRVAVAVSGGGDSMALLALMRDAGGWQVQAVTVDHGLRPEAAEEAAMVARVCAGLGVAHQILRWDHGGAVAGNVMAAARAARLRLIGDWARGQGLGHVALAHTAQDQAETLLMGLGRAAGLDGLAGMRPLWRQDGLLWSRPLLAFGREALRDVLRARGLPWAEDPTNSDDRYLRARLRRALQHLAPLGLTVPALAASAAHLASARGALDRLAQAAGPQVAVARAGALRLDAAAFAALEPELARRVLIMALHWLAPAPHGPRAAALARLQAAVAEGRAATLAGCRLIARREGLWLLREPRSLGAPVAAGQVWDGRWRLSGPAEAGDRIGPLGAEGLALAGGGQATGLPRAVLLVSPAVWRGGRLIAAPAAGFAQGWHADCGLPFTLGQDRALKLAE